MAIDHPAATRLKEKFPNLGLKGATFRGQVQIAVPREQFLEVVTFLRDDPALRYDMLADVTCVDYLNYPSWDRPRFGLVYIFNSVEKGTPRVIVRVFADENELVMPSLVPLYAGAEWLEREAYDMFGIKFTGHPDLRRVLTWDSFQSYPLRKDYPVTGLGERENYPVITRQSS
jgi:NADH-quinone oxidoreductase subunit C